MVRVRNPPRDFELRGVTAWARHKGSKTLAEGYGVDFEKGQDAIRARLLSFAKEELEPKTLRLEPRVHVELPVKLSHGRTTRREALADLSPGGAFVRSLAPLEVGAKVRLSVRRPLRLLPLVIEGRVAWVRRGGADEGMGIEFTSSGESLRKAIAKLVERYAAPSR